MSHPSHRSWFYRLIVLYAVGHIVLLIPAFIDLVTHPLATQLFNKSPLDPNLSILYRLALGLVVAPFSLVIAILILRRAGGNINGMFLLLHSALVMGATLRMDAPLSPMLAALNTGWMGLWLLGVYFPDGRTAFPRFEQSINALCALEIVAVVVWPLFRPGPLFIPALLPLQSVEDAAQMLLLLPVVFLCLPSLIARYRRGDGHTRLQIRWLAWTFGLLVGTGILLFSFGIIQDTPTAVKRYGPIAAWATLGFAIFVFVTPVIAVGIAILRHRLYDIDIIIRRTLVYSILTAILAAVYFGVVVLTQQVIRALTGQASDLAIVISTLAVAALFAPLRVRIQDIIDRRLYRRKYDSAQVLAQFNQSLRNQVDLPTLEASLLGVVREALQPASVALWVGESTTPSRESDT